MLAIIIMAAALSLSQTATNEPGVMPTAAAATPEPVRTRGQLGLERWTWTIEGQKREALLYVPAAAKKTAAPVVFAFHGHGGSAMSAASSFRMHTLWREAIVVYMEGLPTPGKTDTEGKQNGWQRAEEDQGKRDLKFFDTTIVSLRKECKVDDQRIYAMGHSNGAAFAYVLWETRADTFAAFAPSAAARGSKKLKPKPAMLIAGEQDTVVAFDKQERTIAAVREINGCEPKGEKWGSDCTVYRSKDGPPVVAFIHKGTHKYPDTAPKMVVKFFKEQTKSEGKAGTKKAE